LEGLTIPVIEPVPARLEQILNFEFRDAYELRFSDVAKAVPFYPVAVLGYQTHRRCEIVMGGAIESFAVFFQPAGLLHLFRIPIRDLANQVHEAGSVLGNLIYTLWARMGEAPSFASRVRIIDDFLLLQLVRSCDKFGATADRMLAIGGAVRVIPVAAIVEHGIALFVAAHRLTATRGLPTFSV